MYKGHVNIEGDNLTRLIDLACRNRECLWFTTDQDNELIYLVYKIIESDHMTAVLKEYGNVDEFLNRVKELVKMGLTDSIILPLYKETKDDALKILEGHDIHFRETRQDKSKGELPPKPRR